MRRLLTLLTLTALSSSGSLYAGPGDSEAAIRKLVASMSEVWNAGDMQGYLNLYAKDDETRLVFADVRLVGWQQIHDLYTSTWTDEEKMGNFSTEDVSVAFLDEHTALVDGIFKHQFPTEKIRGAFSLVARSNENNEWKIVFEHTSRGRGAD